MCGGLFRKNLPSKQSPHYRRAIEKAHSSARAETHVKRVKIHIKYGTKLHARSHADSSMYGTDSSTNFSIFRLVVSKGCKHRVGIALGSAKSQPLRALCFPLSYYRLDRLSLQIEPQERPPGHSRVQSVFHFPCLWNQCLFWVLVIEPQLLGLGGRTPAAAAATGASHCGRGKVVLRT